MPQNSLGRTWDFIWVVDWNARVALKHLKHQWTFEKGGCCNLMPGDLWFKLTEKAKLSQGESWCEVCRTSSFDGKVGRWRKKVEHTLMWVKVSVVQLKAGVSAMRDSVCLATVGKVWRMEFWCYMNLNLNLYFSSTSKMYKLGILISILYGYCFYFN